jgi:non-heme chloroperoxidase
MCPSQTPFASPPPPEASVDEDMVEQARPGHGIPSQDPNPAAQMPLLPAEAEREAGSALAGGGMVAGAAVGGAVGGVVGGPVGAVVGVTVGAVMGALGGGAAGTIASVAEGDAPAAAPAVDVRLHMEDSGGEGRAVVLIHGWPLSAEAWGPQVSVLRAAGYRVVAYDRRGFGRSDKPATGYDYDTLADDLQRVLDACDLREVSLVGFSMGGGEVARYIGRFGESRLHSVVFAAAVPPYLLKTADNPQGPLTPEAARLAIQALTGDRAAYFEQFTRHFYSAHGALLATEAQRVEALRLCQQSSQVAALACMEAFGSTDFRLDLSRVSVPTLVIHGEADAIVPIEASGDLTHRAVPHSLMVRVPGAPHGLNATHPQVFNDALLDFLKR